MIDGKLDEQGFTKVGPKGGIYVPDALRLKRARQLTNDDIDFHVHRARKGRGAHVNPRRLRRAALTHRREVLAAATALIIGYDLSAYDEQSAVDAAAFVIVNVDDPDLAGKIRRAIGQSKPWGGYKWIYPGASGWNAATESAAKLRAFGEPPLGSWADYEDNGVDQSQLVDFFRGLDSVGARGGYYTNDWRVDHAALINAVGTRWYWTAGYPGDNSGSFPGWDALRASRPAQLWQFTSTNGTRDQNAVVDQGWYESLGGSGSGGFLMALSDPEQAEVLDWIRQARDGVPRFGMQPLIQATTKIFDSTREVPEFGIPAVNLAAARIVNDLAGKVPIVDGQPTVRALLEATVTAGGVDVPAPGDVLTDAEKAALKSQASDLRAVADALDALSG